MTEIERLLSALALPVRREILWLTWEAERSVGEIVANFDLSAPTITSHLTVLRDAELISRTKRGTTHYYRARRDRLGALEPHLRRPKDDQRWKPHTSAVASAEVTFDTQPGFVTTLNVVVPAVASTVFLYFVDAELLGRWLGDEAIAEAQPGGRWGCVTFGLGRAIRGVYSDYYPHTLLGLRWGFQTDGEIPVPAEQIETTIRFKPTENGTSVTITQPTEHREQADFLEIGWADRLAQLHEAITNESGPT